MLDQYCKDHVMYGTCRLNRANIRLLSLMNLDWICSFGCQPQCWTYQLLFERFILGRNSYLCYWRSFTFLSLCYHWRCDVDRCLCLDLSHPQKSLLEDSHLHHVYSIKIYRLLHNSFAVKCFWLKTQIQPNEFWYLFFAVEIRGSWHYTFMFHCLPIVRLQRLRVHLLKKLWAPHQFIWDPFKSFILDLVR